MWLGRLLWVAVVLAFAVATLGAHVRLTDAGLGCPDWPGCYGHLVSLPETAQEIAAAQAQDPRGAYDAGKAAREMLHRYLAGGLGLLILLLTLLCLTGIGNPAPTLKRGMLALLALVTVQALLGMWTVTLQLKPLIVTLHLLGGFATLGLLWWLLMSQCDWPNAPPSTPMRGFSILYALALIALIMQIALGGWTSSNYAALACTDFPTCRGQWWPAEMDFEEAFVLWRGLGVDYEFGVLDSPARVAIHVIHRAGAAVAGGLILLLALVSLRVPAQAWRLNALLLLTLLAIQITLGISNVLLHLPLATALAHHACAALLLLTMLAQGHLLTRRHLFP